MTSSHVPVIAILLLSIGFQAWAAVMAVRLIRITGWRTAWSLITVAIALMAVRRIVPLFRLLIGDVSAPPDMTNEIVGLVLSICMAAGIQRIAPLFMERRRAQEALHQVEWMLSGKPSSPEDQNDSANDQGYGDLTALNRGGLISRAIDKSVLRGIVSEYLDMMGTSSAIYEKNGDYAFGIFTSHWCRLMDRASRELCHTDDNASALASGKWLCHESCWTQCSKKSIETGAPVDIECSGGIRLYSLPIFADREVIGAINFGYGDPPKDPEKLRALADSYALDYQELTRQAGFYDTRPPFIIEMAKRRLQFSASLIGTMVERRRAEKSLRRSNRELRAISKCNKALVRVEDEETLLNDVCRIVCDEAGYRMAWVGYAEQDESRTIRPVAWAGVESGYIAKALPSWSDSMDHGHVLADAAVRSGENIYIQDFATDPRMAPWREAALQRGYRSGLAQPLKDDRGNVFGVLLIYSAETHAVTPEEIKLMEDLADDLAFGIMVLRARAERKKTENALKASEERFRRLAENARDFIFRLSLPGGSYEYVSPAVEALFGYTPAELYRTPLLIRTIIHPDWHRYFEDQWANLLRGEMPPTYEFAILTKSGDMRWVNQRNILVRDEEGRIIALEGIVTDITERKKTEEYMKKQNEELEERIKKRTFELEAKNKELDRMNKLFVGRELKMVELKQRIRELEQKIVSFERHPEAGR